MTANFEQRVGDAICEIAKDLKKLAEPDSEERRALRRIEDKLNVLLKVHEGHPAVMAMLKASTEREATESAKVDAAFANLEKRFTGVV